MLFHTNRHEFPSQQRMKADSERIVALPTFGRAGSRWAMPTLRQPIEIMTFLNDFHTNSHVYSDHNKVPSLRKMSSEQDNAILLKKLDSGSRLE